MAGQGVPNNILNRTFSQLILACLIWHFSLICVADDALATAVSHLENDEHLIFFNTAANLNRQNSQWQIPVHGWIYEPQNSVVRKAIIAKLLKVGYDLGPTESTQENFDRRVNLLMADNESGRKVVIRIAGRIITLPASSANGHFRTTIKLSRDVVARYAKGEMLNYSAVLNITDTRKFSGRVKIIPPTGISVISDIDDTVKISEVTDHKKLFEYTFFKDFVAAPGMSKMYQAWSQRNVSFHYVSSSPWHLYAPLLEFTQKEKFPWATFSLKMIRLKDKTILNIFKKGTETKPRQIEPILLRYPERKFILVGDSGEQDPEVYASLLRKYPSQIINILIRNVTHSSASDPRFSKVFERIAKNKWQLFEDVSDIAVPIP